MHMPLSSVECLILSYERSLSDLLGGLYAKLSTLHKVASWGINADFFYPGWVYPKFVHNLHSSRSRPKPWITTYPTSFWYFCSLNQMQHFSCVSSNFLLIRKARSFSIVRLKSLLFRILNNILKNQNTWYTFHTITKHSSKWNWFSWLKGIIGKSFEFRSFGLPSPYGLINHH